MTARLGGDVGPRRCDVAVEHRRALGETGCAREDPSPGRDDPERRRDPRSQCIRRPDHRRQPDSRDDQCDARRSPQKDEDHSSPEVRGHVRGRRKSRVVDDRAERLVDGESDEEGDREAECSPACDAKRGVHDVSFREVPGRVPGDLSEQHRFPGPPGSSLPGCNDATHDRQLTFPWRPAGMDLRCSLWGRTGGWRSRHTFPQHVADGKADCAPPMASSARIGADGWGDGLRVYRGVRMFRCPSHVDRAEWPPPSYDPRRRPSAG